MVSTEVPFNRPYVPASSLRSLGVSMRSSHLSGDGPMSRSACKALNERTGGSYSLLTPSCTHALELAVRLAEVGPGDEVIVPSYNFPSSATAIALTGATPVFIDCEPGSRVSSVNQVRRALTDRTRAVIVLHYGGIAVDQLAIRALADQHSLVMIEDAAHGVGIHGPEAMIGSVGDLSTYSFHETKNLQCGEGGALQINNQSLVERAQVLREKGTNRSKFFQGLVDKYTWVDHGSSWLLADPLAAILLGQLESFDEIHNARRRVFERYENELAAWSVATGFRVDATPDNQSNAAHLFALEAPDRETRDALLRHLRSRHVGATFHYQPLHSSPAGLKLGRTNGPNPVSQRISDTVIRLPLFVGLSSNDQDRVIRSVQEFSPTPERLNER